MRGLECELCELACVSLSCACRVSLLRLRRAMLRASVPRFAACRAAALLRALRCAAPGLCTQLCA